MRQVIGHWPDASEQWKEVQLRVRECDLNNFRVGRRLAPQECGIEVEKRDDEGFTIVQRCVLDEPLLKRHEILAKQPRLALEWAEESREVARVERADDLRHDIRLPRSNRYCLLEVQRLSEEVLDESGAAHASIDQCAELGIERDGSFQQKRRDRLVLEAASAHERLIDGGPIVPGLVERTANSFEITQCGKELERPRQQAFVLKQLQQPP